MKLCRVISGVLTVVLLMCTMLVAFGECGGAQANPVVSADTLVKLPMGEYSVGIDIPSGLYVVQTANNEDSVVTIKGSDRLPRGLYQLSASAMLTFWLGDGETVVMKNGGELVSLSDRSFLVDSQHVKLPQGSGRYLVGWQIPAGKYKICSSGDGGMYDIATMEQEKTVGYGSMVFVKKDEAIEVNLSNDQFIALSNLSLEWVP